MKKLLSLVLSVLMLVTAVPTAAFAAQGPVDQLPKTGTVNITMNKDGESKASMCDPLFAKTAKVTLAGEQATLEILVANPVPGFPTEGQDGTVKDFTVFYGGKSYVAASDLKTKPLMTAKVDQPMFGLAAGQKYPAQVLTVALPAAALQEKQLDTSAFVNVFMQSTQDFDMVLTGLDIEDPVTFPFGPDKVQLRAGTYDLPVSLMKDMDHNTPSAAGTAVLGSTLVVDKDGSAHVSVQLGPVTVGPITDWGRDWQIYTKYWDDTSAADFCAEQYRQPCEFTTHNVGGVDQVDSISFDLPFPDKDGVYVNIFVPAMGSNPDAYLKFDFAHAVKYGDATFYEASHEIFQFGQYDVHVKVGVRDNRIEHVDISASRYTEDPEIVARNKACMAQVTEALGDAWNGMEPTQDNAEAIYNRIEDPDVVDTVSGATYSAKGVRDAVMKAFGLHYERPITVPEKVDAGVYEVEIAYYADIGHHSLVENDTAPAILTVEENGDMQLEVKPISGSAKEPMYIMNLNGVYPLNDREQIVTFDRCSQTKKDTSFSDQYYEKGTQVVDTISFPLTGGMNAIYYTNMYLYVPAMNNLNGDHFGVMFDHGKFHTDICAKIYWDTLTPLTLEAPQLQLTTKASSGKPVLSWEPVEGAEEYEVFRKVTKNGVYEPFYTAHGTKLTNGSAKAGTTYYYKVRAISHGVASEFSPSKYITCDLPQPDVTMTTNSKGKPVLTWDKVSGAVEYQVYRSVDDGPFQPFYTAHGTKLTNGSAERGHLYRYQVVAVASNSYANSARSEIVSCDLTLDAPLLLLTTKASTGKPVLSWTEVEGADSYEVWRKAGKNGTYKLFYTARGTKLTNSSAKAGTTYYYKVRAIGDGNYGDFSSVKSITCDCARPDVSISLNKAGKPVLTWDKVDGAINYDVYRAESKSGTYRKLTTVNGTKLTNGSADKGHTYYYKVQACGRTSYADSVMSPVVSIRSK